MEICASLNIGKFRKCLVRVFESAHVMKLTRLAEEKKIFDNPDELFGEPSNFMTINDRLTFYESQLDSLTRALSLRADRSRYTLYQLKRRPLLTGKPNVRFKNREIVAIMSRIEDLRSTISSLYNMSTKKEDSIMTESAVLDSEMSDGKIDSDHMETTGNVVDVTGATEDFDYCVGMSDASSQGQKEVLYMDDFFERPVEIATFSLAVSTALSTSYAVWDLYTLNPAVRSKLRNYAYLRGNLHIRVSCSASPFHYGRVLLSYQPYPGRNKNIEIHESNLSLDPTWRPLFLNYLSQAPGMALLNVNTNKPIEIVCPFLSTKPMHRLYNSATTAISDVTSFDDLTEAGSLYVYTMNSIKAASATPSDAYFQIYAWMTDVELGTTTATQVGITTESLVLKGDERETGPVERFSSAMATASSYVSFIPTLGPLSRASQMMFTGMSKMAAILGWSKPVIISNPKFVKNEPFRNGAQLIGGETLKRITLDPKQELTIDPKALGGTEDEMTIRHISSRVSYLTTFTWADDSAVLDTPLFQCRVHPNLVTSVNNGVIVYFQPTALAFAAQPFAYWRGDIKFIVDVVCSDYHRGKLAVYFEPNIGQSALIAASIDTNKQFIKIFDIQEVQTVEFCVKWAFPRAWARGINPEFARSNFQLFSATSNSYRNVNGFITIVPFTKLQSPDNSDISVNIFVSCDNLQVNQIRGDYIPTTRDIITESYCLPSGQLTDISCLDLNESTASTDTIAQEHFGELPVSFRALLKRYTTTATEAVSADATTNKVLVYQTNIVPLINGQYGDPSNPYHELFSYLRYAYVGLRGGMKKRFHLWCEYTLPQLARLRVSLDDPVSASVIPSVSFTTAATITVIDGTISFIPDTNAGIEFELPMYTNNLFLFSFAEDLIGTNAVNDMDEFWTKSYTIDMDLGGATPIGEVQEETAAGEDFTMMRFQGAPYYSF